MELLVIGLLAVEEQEGVDEEWQVGNHADIEGPVVLEDVRIYTEMLREVEVHVSTGPHAGELVRRAAVLRRGFLTT